MIKHMLTPDRLFFVWIALALLLAWTSSGQALS